MVTPSCYPADGANRAEQSSYGGPIPTLRDLTPSPEDVLLTREIVEAGKLLDVEVLDHLVIGHGKYTSMREKGLGFSK